MDTADSRDALRDAKYVSLATFRRNGAMVATPVWCAADGETLYVFSAGDAGKVKRLRNSNRARLAICSFNGELLGEWVPAHAELVREPTEVTRALAALRRKYGAVMRLTDLFSRMSGRYHKRAYIRIKTT